MVPRASESADKCKEACYAYEELIDKFGSSLTLLNGLAVAKMHQKDYDEAQKRLQEVRRRCRSFEGPPRHRYRVDGVEARRRDM